MSKENLFNWCDFYNFADTFSDSNNSAELRSAISRMYYAIFCKSRDYIIENNYYLSKDSKKVMNSKTGMVHSETIKILMNHNQFDSLKSKKVARELSRIRKSRNKADYHSFNHDLKYEFRFVKSRVKIISDYLFS